MIPYDKIDSPVRELVRILNEIWGVQTLSSCCGHGPDDAGYVSFCADPKTVEAILAGLPFLGVSGGFAFNRPFSRALWVSVSLMEGRGLCYSLRFSGWPEWAQKDILCEIESALRQSPTATPPAQPSDAGSET